MVEMVAGPGYSCLFIFCFEGALFPGSQLQELTVLIDFELVGPGLGILSDAGKLGVGNPEMEKIDG